MGLGIGLPPYIPVLPRISPYFSLRLSISLVSLRCSTSPYISLYLPSISGEHEVCRWSLAGSNDGHEWVELHAGREI